MLLEATRISKSFGRFIALNAIDFAVDSGEICALAGENGSGKSTFMRILHGELTADAGSMRLDGTAYSPSSPLEAMKSGIALVHQELALSNHLTITENIFLGAERGNFFGVLSKSEMRQKTEECLAQLGYESLSPDTQVGRLSTAQKQVVEIARALRSDARVVLFDEPTSSLGHHDVEQLFEMIRTLKQRGKAIVYITHFLDEITQLCDRVCVLRDGENAGQFKVSETSTSEIASAMAGKELGQVYPVHERKPEGVLLKVNHLVGKRSPKEVTFEVRKGEVLGIAGLSGAGRSETVRCLFGLDAIQSGTIQLHNEDHKPTPRISWTKKLGFVSEDRKMEGLALTMSITYNIVMPHSGSFFLNKSQENERIDALVTSLGIKCQSSNQRLSGLSGGNQQKVALGRLLDSGSDIFILDEPTKGIDLRSKAEIYKQIDDLANSGKTVLLISSQLSELLGLCDRIIVLRRGELVAEMNPSQTTESELLEVCAGA